MEPLTYDLCRTLTHSRTKSFPCACLARCRNSQVRKPTTHCNPLLFICLNRCCTSSTARFTSSSLPESEFLSSSSIAASCPGKWTAPRIRSMACLISEGLLERLTLRGSTGMLSACSRQRCALRANGIHQGVLQEGKSPSEASFTCMEFRGSGYAAVMLTREKLGVHVPGGPFMLSQAWLQRSKQGSISHRLPE